MVSLTSGKNEHRRKVISTCVPKTICFSFSFFLYFITGSVPSIDAFCLQCVASIEVYMHFHSIQIQRWQTHRRKEEKKEEEEEHKSTLCRMNGSLSDYITYINILQINNFSNIPALTTMNMWFGFISALLLFFFPLVTRRRHILVFSMKYFRYRFPHFRLNV